LLITPSVRRGVPFTEKNKKETRQLKKLAQTLKELNRGERTAMALESHLDSVERKIDELLKQAEADQKARDEKRKVAAEESKGSTHG